MKAIWIVMLAALLPAPLAAQKLDCGEPANRTACEAQALAEQRTVYGAAPLEQLTGKGQMLRVFYYNAFRRNLGLIAVTRTPGSEPRIETRFDSDQEPRPDKDRLTALLPLADWNRLWDESRFFDRTLGPPPPSADGGIMVCADGRGVIVEMIDEDGRIRRATGSSCDRDLAYSLAEKVATAALEADPACTLLTRLGMGEDIRLLNDCRKLSGDRAAAAQAFNVLSAGAFLYPDGVEDAPAVRQYLEDEIALNWPGEAAAHGIGAAARSWASHGRDGNFFAGTVFGETADRVRVEGIIALTPGEHETGRRTARVTMIWERKNGYDFRLRSLVSADPPPPPDVH